MRQTGNLEAEIEELETQSQAIFWTNAETNDAEKPGGIAGLNWTN